MRLRPLCLLVALASLCATPPAAAGAAAPERHVVRFAADSSADDRGAAAAAAGARTLRRTARRRVVLVDAAGARRLREDPSVVSVERDAPVRLAAAVPDDPSFDLLYGLRNAGQAIRGVAGTAGQDIGALRAWDVTRGAGVTVAVLDTGTDVTQPDLAPNLWANPGETAGNGVDDDADGRVDDVRGWNLVAGSANVADDNGHGTHVAGTILSAADNGVGIAGVAPESRLLTVKVLAADGSGWTSDVADGFRYAATHGARIVNASLSGSVYSGYLRDALVAHPDVLLVAAAGNDGLDIDAAPQYPCAYDLPNVVCVAAHDNTGALAGFSNRGDALVDLAAPGRDIASWWLGGGLAWSSGTSMAAPHVAGAAALAAAARPDAGPSAVRAALVRSARGSSVLAGTTVSGGALDAAALLADLGATTTSDPTPPSDPTPAPGPTPAPTPPAIPPTDLGPAPSTTVPPVPSAPTPIAPADAVVAPTPAPIAPAPVTTGRPRTAPVGLTLSRTQKTRRGLRVVGTATRAGTLVLRVCRRKACGSSRGRVARGRWSRTVSLPRLGTTGATSVSARLVDARSGRTLARARRG